MSTRKYRPLVAVTDENTDRDGWLEARTSRVTASEVHTIAVGGRSAWKRILDDKLNGSTFKGNAHTARGHIREPFLLDFAKTFIDPLIEPNSRLFVHSENDRIGATPDGLRTLHGKWGRIGVEVKSHEHGWDDSKGIPQEHYDQMQLGIYVTDADRWVYVWETMGADGEPTLDEPRHMLVERDERRIAFLVDAAERFLAWWDAGAPDTDDLPDALDDALTLWAHARERKKAAEADENKAEAIVRAHIASTPGAEVDGLKLAGLAAQLVYSVTEKDALDPDAWEAAEPESHAAWVKAQASVNEVAETATRLYHKTVRSTRLTITPTKDAA